MFYNIRELEILLGIPNFDIYYNECIEEMLPFTLSEQPAKETNHDNESI
nr:MAG TPA: hypothetical protein [Caudoviricetes sp.]